MKSKMQLLDNLKNKMPMSPSKKDPMLSLDDSELDGEDVQDDGSQDDQDQDHSELDGESEEHSPLADASDDDLLKELKARGLLVNGKIMLPKKPMDAPSMSSGEADEDSNQ